MVALLCRQVEAVGDTVPRTLTANAVIDEVFGQFRVRRRMSGNGVHVVIQCELANDAESLDLCRRLLVAIKQRFDQDCLRVDTTVANAGRLMKLAGTVSRKGTPSESRPHRVATLLDPSWSGGRVMQREDLKAMVASLESQLSPQLQVDGTTPTSSSSAMFLGHYPRTPHGLLEMLHDLWPETEVISHREKDDGGFYVFLRNSLVDPAIVADHDTDIGVRIDMASGSLSEVNLHDRGAEHSGRDILAEAARRFRDPDLPAATSPKGRLQFVCMADLQEEKVRWLVPTFMPLGALVVMTGDGGVGKSTANDFIAACLSRGLSPIAGGDLEGTPINTLLLCPEDSPTQTVKPRLTRFNADMSRITTLKTGSVDDESGPAVPTRIYLDDQRHQEQLEEFIVQRDVRLVIVDPVTATIGCTDTNSNTKTRDRLLGPLASIAQRRDCVVLIVVHQSKNLDASGAQKISGTNAYNEVPRSVIGVEAHPDDPDRIVIFPMKNNLVAEHRKHAFVFNKAANPPDMWEGIYDGDWRELGCSRRERRDSERREAAKNTTKTSRASEQVPFILAESDAQGLTKQQLCDQLKERACHISPSQLGEVLKRLTANDEVEKYRENFADGGSRTRYRSTSHTG